MASCGAGTSDRSVGRRKNRQPRAVLGDQRGEQIRIQRGGILESACDGVLGVDAEVDGHVAERQAEIDEERFAVSLLASARAKLEASVVTPQPPLVPRKTNSLPVFLSSSWGGGAARWRRGARESSGNFIGIEGQGEEFADTCAHEAGRRASYRRSPSRP